MYLFYVCMLIEKFLEVTLIYICMYSIIYGNKMTDIYNLPLPHGGVYIWHYLPS